MIQKVRDLEKLQLFSVFVQFASTSGIFRSFRQFVQRQPKDHFAALRAQLGFYFVFVQFVQAFASNFCAIRDFVWAKLNYHEPFGTLRYHFAMLSA
jgi:hypothetical protein